MIFINKTGSEKIDRAIEFVDLLLKGCIDPKYFMERILEKQFTYIEYGQGVFKTLIDTRVKAETNPIDILPYKPKWPWSKAIGYSDGKNIYVNMRKIDALTVADYVGNLVHEFCHVAGFSHGDNYKKGKENSVPYWCGELAKRMYEESMK